MRWSGIDAIFVHYKVTRGSGKVFVHLVGCLIGVAMLIDNPACLVYIDQ